MAGIPATSKAVIFEKQGGPEVLEYRTDYPSPPAPKEGQLLVKTNLVGVNFIDTYFRSGLYPSALPRVLGQEGTGTVVAVGGAKSPYGFKEGDRVIWFGPSTYAEYALAPAEKTIKIPDWIDEKELLASFLSGMTVLSLARETYPVKKGDWVLLHAAAGGAGFLFTQILKHLGAHVIGTAGGPEKVELVKSLGADVVIDYRSEEGKDWVKKVKEVTHGQGVDGMSTLSLIF